MLPLYGCIQQSDLHCCTSATVFVHKVCGAVAPRTVGYNSDNEHGSTQPQEENTDANGILVQPLKGSIQLADLRCRTGAHTAFVHILGDPVVPRAGGVRF